MGRVWGEGVILFTSARQVIKECEGIGFRADMCGGRFKGIAPAGRRRGQLRGGPYVLRAKCDRTCVTGDRVSPVERSHSVTHNERSHSVTHNARSHSVTHIVTHTAEAPLSKTSYAVPKPDGRRKA